MKDIPFIAIGNDELANAKPAGTHIDCPHCKKKHKIKFGTCRKLLPDGTYTKPEKSSLFAGFYTCKKKTYLASIDGKLFEPKPSVPDYLDGEYVSGFFPYNELHRTHDQEWETLERMTEYGGSFVKQLRILYEQGDQINKAKLRKAFRHYFIHYRDWQKKSPSKAGQPAKGHEE